jgi:hypothetical protein
MQQRTMQETRQGNRGLRKLVLQESALKAGRGVLDGVCGFTLSLRGAQPSSDIQPTFGVFPRKWQRAALLCLN